jgi:hypothetical protein
MTAAFKLSPDWQTDFGGVKFGEPKANQSEEMGFASPNLVGQRMFSPGTLIFYFLVVDLLPFNNREFCVEVHRHSDLELALVLQG